MKIRLLRRCTRVLFGVSVLTALSGCTVFSDALNPNFASLLGVSAPSNDLGSIIVRFSNDTDETASLFADVSDDATDATANVRNGISGVLDAGGEAAHVFDCPVGVITVLPTNVFPQAGAAVQLPFTGAPLVAGADYLCGDVIEVRVIRIGDGVTAADFLVQVQVYPGR